MGPFQQKSIARMRKRKFAATHFPDSCLLILSLIFFFFQAVSKIKVYRYVNVHFVTLSVVICCLTDQEAADLDKQAKTNISISSCDLLFLWNLQKKQATIGQNFLENCEHWSGG